MSLDLITVCIVPDSAWHNHTFTQNKPEKKTCEQSCEYVHELEAGPKYAECRRDQAVSVGLYTLAQSADIEAST